jgi:hypothetical protein
MTNLKINPEEAARMVDDHKHDRPIQSEATGTIFEQPGPATTSLGALVTSVTYLGEVEIDHMHRCNVQCRGECKYF